jgi:hypothetical protein
MFLTGHPQQKFGIVHLLSRSVSDLLAGGHLAAHCYVAQAYSVLRPVLDSYHLIELFASDADEATSWTTTTRAPRRFRASRCATAPRPKEARPSAWTLQRVRLAPSVRWCPDQQPDAGGP